MNDGVYSKIITEAWSWFTSEQDEEDVWDVWDVPIFHQTQVQGVFLSVEESRLPSGSEKATGDEPPPLFSFLVLPPSLCRSEM